MKVFIVTYNKNDYFNFPVLKQSEDDPTNANCPERAKASETPQKLVSSQDEGLPEEICSAKPKCLRPVQTRPDIWQVDWVQCDGKCQLWFHLFCIRLRKDQVNQNNDYFCKECKLDDNNKEVRCFINTFPFLGLLLFSSHFGNLFCGCFWRRS